MRTNDPQLTLECPPGTEYDERVFLYLLCVERARAERWNRPIRLVLVTVEPNGTPVPIPPPVAAKLFKSLRMSLRETDVTGWYREDLVAGAILSECAEPTTDASDVIQTRVGEELRRALPEKFACSLRVQVSTEEPERLGIDRWL